MVKSTQIELGKVEEFVLQLAFAMQIDLVQQLSHKI